jgi:hypothetical protein
MSNLSQAQRDLLVLIAETDGCAIDAPTDAKTTIAALIRRGLIFSVPREDRASQLLITAQGREAIGADAEPAGNVTPTAANTSTPSEGPVAPQAGAPAIKGKLGAVIELLRRPGGARLDELMAATGWQAHSVRGALAGAVKKKLGLVVISEKIDGVRIYRVPTEAAA